MSFSLLQRAELLIEGGDLAAALAALDEHLRAHPDDEAARRLRIAVCLRLPDPQHAALALADLDALASFAPADAIARWRLLREADPRSAAAALAAGWAASGDPRLAEPLIAAYCEAGETGAAQAILNALPETAGWLAWRARVSAAAGDVTAALAAYDAALTRFERAGDPLSLAQAVALREERARLVGLPSRGGTE
jgi:tetratricopeptide (TPR) repeat protein